MEPMDISGKTWKESPAQKSMGIIHIGGNSWEMPLVHGGSKLWENLEAAREVKSPWENSI